MKDLQDIKKTIEDRVSFYSILADNAQIHLSSSFGPNIPEKMMFDVEGVDHVLNNLISNSLKYSNKDKEVKVITFLHDKDKDINEEAHLAKYDSINVLPKDLNNNESSVVVLIEDCGIGIAEEDVPRIFNKFKQLDTKNAILKKQKGTGLGLVITKSIVEEHGGHVGVVSKIGVGSTFFFTLPLI